jgi:hypothetical protein
MNQANGEQEMSKRYHQCIQLILFSERKQNGAVLRYSVTLIDMR